MILDRSPCFLITLSASNTNKLLVGLPTPLLSDLINRAITCIALTVAQDTPSIHFHSTPIWLRIQETNIPPSAVAVLS